METAEKHSIMTQSPVITSTLESFAGITDPTLLDSLTRLSITTPTPVQKESIPRILGEGDFIVEAQTGSGKTLAFVLPILSKLIEAMPYNGNFALIVTPTRELATQVASVVQDLLPEIEPAVIIGGAKQEGQVRSLRRDSRIVVGTPGRIIDLIEQRELQLRRCKMFVLDEADEMLSMGFIDEVRAILSRLPKQRQGLFFSATMTPRVLSLASSFLIKPTRVELEPVVETSALIDHIFCRVDAGLTSKAQALAAFLTDRKPKSAIVFCNTKSDTEILEILLRKRGIESKRINSDLSQKERDRTMNSFRTGETTLLIATDVAARGIDVSDIELVVNYSLHETPETYVHRTGRTGRAGKSGTALTLVAPQDFPLFYNLSRKLPATLTEVAIPL
jgi:superfamily II DNA/RNA helicase